LSVVACRQVSQESLKKRQEAGRNRPAAPGADGEPPPPRATKAGGWLPSADGVHARSELDDPLLQQIDNIRSFLRQARAARRMDEVAMLEENLRQLQDEFDQQQTGLAIALSQRLAAEESLQRGELDRLEAREREGREGRERGRGAAQPPIAWVRPLGGSGDEEDADGGDLTPKAERSPSSAGASLPALAGREESPPRLRRLGGHVTPPGGEGQNRASLNPFDEEGATPTEEDPSNPFFEDMKREHEEGAGERKAYNPFDEEDERAEASGNPFADGAADAGNPFLEARGSSAGVSTNPFDGGDDDAAEEEEEEEEPPDVDVIEEELLLQQIGNIRAYVFDAKLSGRLDEVELLSANLRELQHALREQKKKTH